MSIGIEVTHELDQSGFFLDRRRRREQDLVELAQVLVGAPVAADAYWLIVACRLAGLPAQGL
ncbi:hypothetical protein D3C79_1024250 [compost metagenome]